MLLANSPRNQSEKHQLVRGIAVASTCRSELKAASLLLYLDELAKKFTPYELNEIRLDAKAILQETCELWFTNTRKYLLALAKTC